MVGFVAVSHWRRIFLPLNAWPHYIQRRASVHMCLNLADIRNHNALVLPLMYRQFFGPPTCLQMIAQVVRFFSTKENIASEIFCWRNGSKYLLSSPVLRFCKIGPNCQGISPAVCDHVILALRKVQVRFEKVWWGLPFLRTHDRSGQWSKNINVNEQRWTKDRSKKLKITLMYYLFFILSVWEKVHHFRVYAAYHMEPGMQCSILS